MILCLIGCHINLGRRIFHEKEVDIKEVCLKREDNTDDFILLFRFAEMAQKIINGHWSAVRIVADELVKRGDISYAEFERLLSDHGIKRESGSFREEIYDMLCGD